MNKAEIELSLTICFYNEFLIGGGKGSGIIQNYIQRDFLDRPYIPATTLKGRIRHHAGLIRHLFNDGEQLYNDIFGGEGVKKGTFYFDHANLKNSDDFDSQLLTNLRTGISINRFLKTNIDSHLHTDETSGYGGQMVFNSGINGFVHDYKKYVAFIVASIRLIRFFGGRKSAGLGWLAEPIAIDTKINGSKFELKDIQKWATEVLLC